MATSNKTYSSSLNAEQLAKIRKDWEELINKTNHYTSNPMDLTMDPTKIIGPGLVDHTFNPYTKHTKPTVIREMDYDKNEEMIMITSGRDKEVFNSKDLLKLANLCRTYNINLSQLCEILKLYGEACEEVK